MENLFTKKVPLYYETEESQLILGDSFKILTKMEPESVDMIFADPPYFLSNDGIIICEMNKEDSFDFSPFKIIDEKKYGIKKVCYLKKDE